MAAKDEKLAYAIAEGIYEVDSGLILLGLSGSQLIKAGEETGLKVANGSICGQSLSGGRNTCPALAERGCDRRGRNCRPADDKDGTGRCCDKHRQGRDPDQGRFCLSAWGWEKGCCICRTAARKAHGGRCQYSTDHTGNRIERRDAYDRNY